MRLLVLFFFSCSMFAQAKKVTLQWDEVEGAKGYEIELTRNGKPYTKEPLRVEKAKWSKLLPPGVYSYHMRAIDWRIEPGNWSNWESVAVPADSPVLGQPVNGSVVASYYSRSPISLSWNPSAGATHYLVEVLKDGAVIEHVEIQKTTVSLFKLPPAEYTWNVKSVIKVQAEATQSYPPCISSPSKTYRFTVEQKPLPAPEIIAAVGEYPGSKDEQYRYRWKKSEGAEAYEFILLKNNTETIRKAVTHETSVAFSTPVNGKYEWRVRALASVDSHGVAEVQSAHTSSELFIGTSRDKNIELRLSTSYLPYKYQMTSHESDFEGSGNASGVSTRLDASFPISDKLKLDAGFENTTIKIPTGKQALNEASLGAEYSLPWLSGFARTFALVGATFREYLGIAPTNVTRESTVGPMVGFGLLKSWGKTEALFQAQYFVPAIIVRSEASKKLGPSVTLTNIQIAADLKYSIYPYWGVLLGGYWKRETVKYLTPQSNPEEIALSGFGVALGLQLSF